MKSALQIPLNTTPAQRERLAALQKAFARACNALAPTVRHTRCWNRVALHHMAYKQLRQQFPDMGSQMICNAIYSVSRVSRLVYQHPKSVFNIARLGNRPLPLLQFTDLAPVYFDRHTLSIKAGQISMFTLDGRMRFQLDVSGDDERRFRDERLREIVLTSVQGRFMLSFYFASDASDIGAAGTDEPRTALADLPAEELPEYVLVLDDDVPAPFAAASPPANASTATPLP